MFKQILKCLWQLPQVLLGWLFRLIYPAKYKMWTEDGVEVIFSDKMHGGISLGTTVVVHTHNYEWESQPLECNTVKHELGHCKQSQILGPLYLLVIGLPSLLWAWLQPVICPNVSYYWFYTENWADKLGNVIR